jgi:hypothetical protein
MRWHADGCIFDLTRERGKWVRIYSAHDEFDVDEWNRRLLS